MICDRCGIKPSGDYFSISCQNGCTNPNPPHYAHIIRPHGYIIIHDDYWINKFTQALIFTQALDPIEFHNLTPEQFVQMIALLLDGLDEI